MDDGVELTMFLQVEREAFLHSVVTVGNRRPLECFVGVADAEKLQIMDIEVDSVGQTLLDPFRLEHEEAFLVAADIIGKSLKNDEGKHRQPQKCYEAEAQNQFRTYAQGIFPR